MKNKKIKLIALFGMSGAGKDSIQYWLIHKLNAHKLISYTTRPKRSYEINGKDYYFVDSEKFYNLIQDGKILEYTSFNSWLYGTCIDDLEKDKINIGIFNIQSLKELLYIYSDIIDILPIWIHAFDKTRLTRNFNREINPNYKEICRRFLSDYADFSYNFMLGEKDWDNIEKIFQDIDKPFDFEFYLNETNEDYSGILNRPKLKNFLNGQN